MAALPAHTPPGLLPIYGSRPPHFEGKLTLLSKKTLHFLASDSSFILYTSSCWYHFNCCGLNFCIYIKAKKNKDNL
ncbi:hypothetical protein XELAEV_18004377mg [Xenopus laevis]|uniref:Uncharacterized protein n=1 Tax=Xenopus laevis TaxID=8355 RepID=A0A974BMV2_XENLA|nr:hypothetical protein XELAEV_18004377mg [Xenopus laevis]